MNSNFDYDTNTNDSTEGLTTFWEVAEANYNEMAKDDAFRRLADAISASDYAWEVWGEELHEVYAEAMDTLVGYGLSMKEINRALEYKYL